VRPPAPEPSETGPHRDGAYDTGNVPGPTAAAPGAGSAACTNLAERTPIYPDSVGKADTLLSAFRRSAGIS
jgi:hypothetical protein